MQTGAVCAASSSGRASCVPQVAGGVRRVCMFRPLPEWRQKGLPQAREGGLQQAPVRLGFPFGPCCSHHFGGYDIVLVFRVCSLASACLRRGPTL